jgi:hypothetical protein
MSYTREQFIEFCILLGCDYNKGMSVGKVCALLDTYGSYDGYRHARGEIEALNFDLCLSLFKSQPLNELIDGELPQLDISIDRLDPAAFEGIEEHYISYRTYLERSMVVRR